MTPTEEMVRVAAEAICEALFGPFDLAELVAHPSSSSAQSVIAAEAALSAALAAMWQPIETAKLDGLKVTSETFLLSHIDRKWVRFGKWYVQERCWYYSGTNERSQWAQVRGDEPTHWAPFLPAPTLLSTRMGSDA